MIAKVYGEMIKSLKYWRRHLLIAATAIFPPLIFCTVFVGAFTTTGIADLVVVNKDVPAIEGSWTDKFIDVLGARTGTIPYFNIIQVDENKALDMFEMHETFAVLWVPEGFSVDMEEGRPVTIPVKFTAIHEDISKNVRLGVEARVYDFVKTYNLDTGVSPGIINEEHLLHQPLPRPSYMMVGILVWTIVFLGLLVGGALGSFEKYQGTFVCIRMSPHGELASLTGKWLAAVTISALLTTILILCYIIFFGLRIPDITGFANLLFIFLCLSLMFSLLGVLYGMRVGDFRLVPAPMIILSVALWVVSGAINPLEFGAGSEFFKYLPTAAAIRVMSASLFQRGEQFVSQSTVTLITWAMISMIAFAAYFLRRVRGSDTH